ncbi:hypothetical protein M569_17734 [Genlisea aurea]|uniref:Uncharacterized protein n=1 Tax=Genlisea aurea TaxID=192259 RepID=S8DCL0_9LAMI|nr:hypothetical protein M569_17734 [Genlisea aurea]
MDPLSDTLVLELTRLYLGVTIDTLVLRLLPCFTIVTLDLGYNDFYLGYNVCYLGYNDWVVMATLGVTTVTLDVRLLLRV